MYTNVCKILYCHKDTCACGNFVPINITYLIRYIAVSVINLGETVFQFFIKKIDFVCVPLNLIFQKGTLFHC